MDNKQADKQPTNCTYLSSFILEAERAKADLSCTTLSTKKITFIVLKSEKQTSRATKWIIPSWSTLKRYRKLSSRRRWQVHPVSNNILWLTKRISMRYTCFSYLHVALHACEISILRLLKNRRDWWFLCLIEKSRKFLQLERIDNYCKFDNRDIQLFTNFDSIYALFPIIYKNYYLS